MSCIPKNLKKNNKNLNTLFCKESQAALIVYKIFRNNCCAETFCKLIRKTSIKTVLYFQPSFILFYLFYYLLVLFNLFILFRIITVV